VRRRLNYLNQKHFLFTMSLFITAFLLGLVFNAAPGAVFAETVRRAARGGYQPALAVQFGSLVGDATWAILGLAGIGLLLQLEWLRVPVGCAGVAYLLYLAWDSWKAAKQEFTVSGDGDTSRTALRSGVLLSMTNPQNIAYWAAIGSAMGTVGVEHPTAAHYAIFFAGFMASSLLWCFVCAGIVARLFKNANTRWTKVTYQLCAIAFFALAITSLRDLINTQAADRATQPSAPLSAPR
jgi:chemosensory pili system protein ChpE